MTQDFLQALRACCKDVASFERALDLIKQEISKTTALEETLQHTVTTLQGEVRERLEIARLHQEKEMLFRSVFENAAVGIAFTELTDSNYKITRANQAFCAMLGYTDAELQSLSVAEITHPDDFQEQLKLLRQLESNETSTYVFIKRYVKKDGTIFWGRLHGSAFRDAKNRLIFTIVVRNITLEKESAEKLRQNEAQLHWLLNALPFAVALYQDKELIFTNRAFQDSRGFYSFEEVLRARLLAKTDEAFSLIHPGDFEQFIANFDHYREQLDLGKTVEFERRIRKYGESNYKWHQGYLFKGDYVDGSKVVVEVDVPIHERKEAELALLESETRYRQVVETQSDFVLISEPDTTITFANVSLCRALGVELGEIVGKRWIDFAVPNEISDIQTKIKALSPQNSSFITENRDYRAGGVLGWTQWLNQGIFDDDGRLIRLQSVGRDITAIKNAVQALRSSQTKLNAYFNSTAETIILIAPDFTILDFNNVARNSIQAIYRREVLIGDSILDYAEASTKQSFIENFEQALRGEKIEREIEIPFSSDAFWWKVKYLPVIDEDEIIAVAFVSENITKRKLSELALKTSESHLSEMARLAKVGSWQFDVATQKITWSEETFRIFERPIEKGEPDYAEMLSYFPQSSSALAHLVERAVREGVGYEIELKLITEKNSVKHTIVIGNPILVDGKLIRLFGYVQDITERKEQESEKQRLQATLSNILEQTTDGYFSLDKDRCFTYVNESFERLTRVKRDDVIGKNIWEMFKPAAFTLIFDNYEKVFNERVAVAFQEYYAPLNAWFDIHAFPSEDDGLSAYFRDITEEKRQEKSLRENQDFLQSIYYGINTPIFVIDVEPPQTFRFVGLNPAFERNLGIANEQILGKTISELKRVFSDETIEQLQFNFTRCLAAKGEMIFEESLVYNGRDIYLMTQLNPLRDETGKIYRIVGNSLNITKRKQAEEQLRKNEAMLSETERIAQIGSWELDLTNEKLTWSAEVFRIFGRDFSKKEPSFEELQTYFIEQDTERLRQAVSDAIRYAKTYELDLQIDACPMPKHVHVVGKVLLNAEGKTIKHYGTVQDTTKSVQAKAERDAIYEQLLQSQKMESLGILASGVAHEFNNILAGIMGSANLLRKEFEPNTKQAKRIFQIEDSSRRAAAIVKQMLGFARKGKTDLTRFPISQCVEEVVQMIEPTLDRRIQVVIEMEPNLPAIEGDKGQLEQVILNLAVNAHDAMTTVLEQGKEKCVLKFESNYAQIPTRLLARYGLTTQNFFVHLIVSDTGTGIPEEIQKKIFEPFFTTKEVGKGTGLGLAMVYGIVKNHNGFIFVDSRVGEGTAFHLFIPCAEKPVQESTLPVARPARITQSKHILIVDDERVLQETIADALMEAGYLVELASNGAEGLKKFEQSHSNYDLIILDLNMPEINGKNLLRQIKAIRREMIVVVITGYLENNDINILLESGARKILSKPFDTDALLDAVSESLSETNAKNF